jgi:hypothetical protein
MSAESKVPKHPFNQALETWNAWSEANLWQHILDKSRASGEEADLRRRLPDLDKLTQGPAPLEALRANHQLVSFLGGWRWHAVRQAREQGRGWHEIAQALDVKPNRARDAYLERLDRQREVAARNPDVGRLIGYDPALAELADDNEADRAWQHRSAEPRREGGHER